jgi:hypothetical protein
MIFAKDWGLIRAVLGDRPPYTVASNTLMQKIRPQTVPLEQNCTQFI